VPDNAGAGMNGAMVIVLQATALFVDPTAVAIAHIVAVPVMEMELNGCTPTLKVV
jgi:hypothetical protein